MYRNNREDDIRERKRGYERLMNHLALILDGNGRWAEQRGLSRSEGHKEGAKAVVKAIEACDELGIKYVSLYAFSAENFKRDSQEVAGIFEAVLQFLKYCILPNMQEKGYSLKVIGDLSKLPEELQSTIARIGKEGADNNKMTIIIAINYGGQQEVVNAVNKIIAKAVKAQKGNGISYSDIEQSLNTAGMPNPDAVLRYGGYKRLSNFMPLQTVYSELFFVDKLWPDFNKADIEQVLCEYQGIERKFGEVNK